MTKKKHSSEKQAARTEKLKLEAEVKRAEWLAKTGDIRAFFLRRLETSPCSRRELKHLLSYEAPELDEAYEFIELGKQEFQRERSWHESCKAAYQEIYRGIGERIIGDSLLLYKLE